MSDKTDAIHDSDMAPFDDALQEMRAGQPSLNPHVPEWVAELPLLMAIGALFALYIA
ncbi:hypothetical protein [Acidisphaera sp. L21]|jgi:hypothetical protein|uniref:hypothetical protein n=1 Tax=Acidisphaera sp. L21 TaxID=1641851 RepID=UPI00131BDF0B|nr:hypothetical protein [Acidisphaera sp. L21]